MELISIPHLFTNDQCNMFNGLLWKSVRSFWLQVLYYFLCCSSESESKLATLPQTLAAQSGRKASGTASTLALEARELIHTIQGIIEVDCK